MALMALVLRRSGWRPRRARGVLHARPVRRRAVLRRRRDHAGDLGAVRGRGAGGGDAGCSSPTSCRSPRHPGSALFLVQRHGTAQRRRRVRAGHGALVRRAGGARRVCRSSTTRACWPRSGPAYALAFPRCASRRWAFFALGAVFLALTGGEALYADMGHFGRRPIRLAWFALVLPALLLNYFGQGALLLRRSGGDPESVLPAGARAGRCCRWWCSPRRPR